MPGRGRGSGAVCADTPGRQLTCGWMLTTPSSAASGPSCRRTAATTSCGATGPSAGRVRYGSGGYENTVAFHTMHVLRCPAAQPLPQWSAALRSGPAVLPARWPCRLLLHPSHHIPPHLSRGPQGVHAQARRTRRPAQGGGCALEALIAQRPPQVGLDLRHGTEGGRRHQGPSGGQVRGWIRLWPPQPETAANPGAVPPLSPCSKNVPTAHLRVPSDFGRKLLGRRASRRLHVGGRQSPSQSLNA